MATIHIDGKSYEVDGADNLLQACLSLGLDVPYFCWHPALGSVGACRQCAVKQYSDENDQRGRLVMSCMTPAADKTYISIEDAEAKAFRQSVIEWLMTNHPHDCPVCAEGGHCHLQDMTVMSGHSLRRYRFNKRTHNNQYLGPFIRHEMNRCIACYRCVRYYRDYAGGTDLGVFGAHDNVYFGRASEGVLESEFSGNLSEVCPTGVFTDRTHGEHYTRKWDMQFAPSICQGCAVGCNISPGERYGEIRRIENRYNGSINHYFLCDRGRFGYGFVNRSDRPRAPSWLQGGQRSPLSLDAALDLVGGWVRSRQRIAGLGSARASLESNFSLRTLVGAERFFQGLSRDELNLHRQAIDSLRLEGVQLPSLADMEACDAVFVLGEDLTQTAPRVALALRQSVKNEALKQAAARKVPAWNAEPLKNIAQHALSPLHLTMVQATRLDDVAASVYCATPEAQARLGFAVAHAIDAQAPAVSDLSAEESAWAARIAADLMAAARPLVISGVSLACAALVDASEQIICALLRQGRQPALAQVLPEVNSAGLSMLDAAAVEALEQLCLAGEIDTLVVLEADLYRMLPEARVAAMLAKIQHLVVLDHQMTATAERADVLLSAASFAEADGTVVSMEGRAQRYFQVYDSSYYRPQDCLRESWRWLHAIDQVSQGRQVQWTHLDQVTAEIAASCTALSAIVEAAPDARYRIAGLKVAREPRRYSGRTAMRANISVHEPRQPVDHDSALTFSMEGYVGPQESSALIPFAWSPGWTSPQAWNKFKDENGSLRQGDPGVRLFSAGRRADYKPVPPVVPAAGLRTVPLYEIFGSDELSLRSPVIADRAGAACVTLPADSGHAEGSMLEISVDGQLLSLPVRLSTSLAKDCIGLPAGRVKVAAGRHVDLGKGR